MTSQEVAAWVAAIAAFLMVIGSLWAVWWQVRRQRIIHSATIVTDALYRYMSQEWRINRFLSATALRKHASGERIISSDLPVLNFFENMGYLVRKKAVDKEMVWNQFGWYVVRYYFALEKPPSLLERERESENDRVLWEEFEWLAKESLRLYNKRGVYIYKIEDPSITLRIEELLEEEEWFIKTTSSAGLQSLKNYSGLL
jgi:hypothetical protein